MVVGGLRKWSFLEVFRKANDHFGFQVLAPLRLRKQGEIRFLMAKAHLKTKALS